MPTHIYIQYIEMQYIHTPTYVSEHNTTAHNFILKKQIGQHSTKTQPQLTKSAF